MTRLAVTVFSAAVLAALSLSARAGRRRRSRLVGFAERDHALDLLADGFATGRLDAAAFSARLDEAILASTRGRLERAVKGLPR